MIPRLQLRATEAGNPLAGLYPRRSWWALVEDVFNSPAVKDIQSAIHRAMLDRREFLCVSIDATCRICFSLQGQANFRASASVRALSAFTDSESKKKVLTLRGRTGFVALMAPMPNEKDSTIAQTARASLSSESLAQMQHVFSDDPSPHLWTELSDVMPNLKSISLDSTHLAIVYEYATWRRWSTVAVSCLEIRREHIEIFTT